MNDSGVLDAVQALLASDPDVASGAGLGEVSRHSSTLRAFADYVDVRVNQRSNTLAADGAADTGAHVLIDEGRLSGRAARATDGRDRVCSDLPEFDDALASGACTAGHLDVLAGNAGEFQRSARGSTRRRKRTRTRHAVLRCRRSVTAEQIFILYMCVT